MKTKFSEEFKTGGDLQEGCVTLTWVFSAFTDGIMRDENVAISGCQYGD